MSTQPSFIIVGAPRSGSTYLMENLVCHPQVFMPKPLGEHSTGDLHFFDVSRDEGARNFGKGMSWYLDHFRHARPNQKVGEKTADYLSDRQACDLIFEELGAIKIIVLLRDPVMRAYSHFWHERHNLGQFRSFDDFVEHPKDVGDAKIFSSGFYYESLLRYRSRFGEDNVHVILYEDISKKPAVVMRDVCRFLEVDPGFPFPFLHNHVNSGFYDYSLSKVKYFAAFLENLSPDFYVRLRDSHFGFWAKRVFALRRGTAGFSKSNNNKSKYPPISSSQCEAMRHPYYEDVGLVGKLIGKDLYSFWWKSN